jgi:hypothetical protein
VVEAVGSLGVEVAKNIERDGARALDVTSHAHLQHQHKVAGVALYRRHGTIVVEVAWMWKGRAWTTQDEFLPEQSHIAARLYSDLQRLGQRFAHLRPEEQTDLDEGNKLLWSYPKSRSSRKEQRRKKEKKEDDEEDPQTLTQARRTSTNTEEFQEIFWSGINSLEPGKTIEVEGQGSWIDELVGMVMRARRVVALSTQLSDGRRVVEWLQTDDDVYGDIIRAEFIAGCEGLSESMARIVRLKGR